MRFPSAFHKLLQLLIALAVLKGLYHLSAQTWFFLGGASAGDAQYYWTVGRGLLNGHTLYIDIFDTKPPGIYLLSAASFFLFDSPILGYWLNALVALLIPTLFGVTAYKMAQDLSEKDRKKCTALAVLFGISLTLYAAAQAEGWQVEWFGGFFGILYAVLLLNFPQKTGKKFFLLLTLCLFFAIGFKEPFLLVLLGVAILLLPDFRSFLKKFVLPVCAVAISGLTALTLFGFASGYFSFYLPSNFGHHIARKTPMLLRGTQIDLPFTYLGEFSWAFAFLIIVLPASILYFRWKDSEGDNLRLKKMGRSTLIVLGALYLTFTAANMRGYPAASHFVAATPVYTALFFLYLRETIARWDLSGMRPLLIVAFLTALTLVLLPLSRGFPAYARTLQNLRDHQARNQEVALRIDAILDACEVDRYFFVEERPYMPYTAHSPLNFFVYTGPESVVFHSTLIIDEQLTSFSNARIVIAEGDSYEIRERPEEKFLSETTFRFLANRFTILPWSCAENFPTPEGFSILYRKDPNDRTPFPFEIKFD